MRLGTAAEGGEAARTAHIRKVASQFAITCFASAEAVLSPRPAVESDRLTTGGPFGDTLRDYCNGTVPACRTRDSLG
ncbi:MAG: hypothetical protein Kow00109_24070 [Acidobacteriota bacterium]